MLPIHTEETNPEGETFTTEAVSALDDHASLCRALAASVAVSVTRRRQQDIVTIADVRCGIRWSATAVADEVRMVGAALFGAGLSQLWTVLTAQPVNGGHAGVASAAAMLGLILVFRGSELRADLAAIASRIPTRIR